jgi:hypothetical protein
VVFLDGFMTDLTCRRLSGWHSLCVEMARLKEGARTGWGPTCSTTQRCLHEHSAKTFGNMLVTNLFQAFRRHKLATAFPFQVGDTGATGTCCCTPPFIVAHYINQVRKQQLQMHKKSQHVPV